MLTNEEEKPLAFWQGTDRHEGREQKTLTIILKSGGCSWNRCLMCSYRHERYMGLSKKELADRLIRQLRFVTNAIPIKDVEIIKLYTSGSFFDPDEVPHAVLEEAGALFRGKIIIAETRPEYVQDEVLEDFIARFDDGTNAKPLYVAIGLETTNDRIREKSIDKGFSSEDFNRAVRAARNTGTGIKAYLLMKPLFLTEKEAMADMKQSLADLCGVADSISMNTCTVQRGTDMERYWKQGAYRPPYLWSVADVLATAPMEVLCDPLGGGQSRGAHNCGECDRDIIDAIKFYSLSGDRSVIKAVSNMECPCRDEWELVLSQEMPWCMPLTR
ncbi:MAG: archaeosine biosynthesis radical SAM protein RaSEA [Methanomicrobiales archaeon]|nr:archaeosine biosynthesis radical SAM protein RaSEA [Methanomicrobiales archaeon]